MPNAGQPTISEGATGDVVRRAQRALRRTPDPGLVVDGAFGPATASAVKQFQQGAGLVVDGIVGPNTWNALPDGGPMPLLQVGSSGPVVHTAAAMRTSLSLCRSRHTSQAPPGTTRRRVRRTGPDDLNLPRGR